jgi:soluble lytic murein transglycosylase-like protein
MARVKYAAVALALACPEPASAEIERWAGEISEASQRFEIPDEWIREVIQAESGGNVSLLGRPVVSRAGAMGLMQLMPATWAEMRLSLGLGHNPFDPHDNIIAGAAYLRAMYDRFGYPGLFAAYNAGPRRFAEHLEMGRPLPRETIAYWSKIAGRAAERRPEKQTPLGLFVTRRASIGAALNLQETRLFACCPRP